ncbi:phage tail protein [Acinetobacter celticus]|uniref:Phage tail protein n=1 Tax=Acinetobacter celticus TaxID=1891224 RepID=A0A1C3CUM0_9GAMM|nr:phage tail protein [Acinetobacter celticus]ODA12433.1 phage tail protein [Acinetobacter celticus]
MKKPQALREYLLKSIPDLVSNQDRLDIFVENGKLRSTLSGGYSFEMAYTLDMTITDYAGDVDLVAFALFTWLATNQSELMANIKNDKNEIIFEAELIDNTKYDLNIKVPLTERVISTRAENGQYNLSYPPEPQYTEFGPPTEFTVLDADGNKLASWTTVDKEGWSLDMPPPGKSP